MIASTQILSAATASLFSLTSLSGGLALPDLSSQSQPTNSTNQSAETTLSAELTAGVNDHRANHDLAPVTESEQLNQQSQVWADHLAENGQFYHDEMTCDGQRCLSENIAITLPEQPMNALGQWIDSPGHNENLLRPEAVEVGHGSAIMQSGGFEGQPVVVQRFVNEY